jgi:plastocyanin
MRSFRAASLAVSFAVVLAAVVVAACGGNRPGWTYLPAPSVTPPPSIAASPSAPPASAPASAPASPGASGAPSPAGPTVTVVATTPLRWDTPELTAPADEPFTLEFDNQDATAPHNVVIKNPDGSNVEMGDTAFFQGPEKRTYQVPALSAGEYQFICEVHPTTMIGTLTVE